MLALSRVPQDRSLEIVAMLYVHVAEAHPRQPPKHVQQAARRIADPDARVLAMLSARSAESSSETMTKPMRRGKRQRHRI